MSKIIWWTGASVALVGCGGAATPAGGPAPRAPELAADSATRAAAALITPTVVLQRLSVIADDSMRGRNTPSRGLELTAQYLADHYRQWGFTPLGDSGSFEQRYTLAHVRSQPATSYIDIDNAGTSQRFLLDRWALTTGPMPGTSVGGPVKVISGAVTAADIEPLTLAGTTVVFVASPERAAINLQVVRALGLKQLAALLIVERTEPAAFAARVAATQRQGAGRPVVAGLPPTGTLTITVHDTLFAGLTNHPDFAAMRGSPRAIVMDAPPEIRLTIVAQPETVSTATAPNVVALMPGSDPVLRNQYVVFSAHMDHIGTAGDGVGGCTAKGADSICNGADDDGSGTTGVLSIAEAVARLKGRIRRSIIVLNVSGEEKGLLGSAWFTAHPPVPLDRVVADINMDMIGRNNPDSIVVIGKQQSDLGTTLAAVQAQHAELHLIAADDIWPAENFYSRSDHFNFARRGVPVLFFFNGLHPQYHQPDDEIGLIDTSKLSRVAQLAFYLGITLADTTPKPRWNAESYQRIVVDQGEP